MAIRRAVYVVTEPGSEKVLMVRHKGQSSWRLPENIEDKPSVWPRREDVRLVAVLAGVTEEFVRLYDVRGGSQLVAQEQSALGLETQFMSLYDTLLSGTPVSLTHKRLIAVWQRQLHTTAIYEGKLVDEVSVTVNNQSLRV